jgi:hypothetical protein
MKRKWALYALPEGFVKHEYPKDSNNHAISRNMMGRKDPGYGYQTTSRQCKYLEEQEQQQCKAYNYTSPAQHSLG